MPEPKFVDGKINFLMKTFDGSFVKSQMFEDEAKVHLSNAKEDASVPGYELVSGNYRFETQSVVAKLRSSKGKKDLDDEI